LNETEKYRHACETEFWQNVFRAESDYLCRALEGCRDVLSVGCGPATVEDALSQRGFRATGLDVSSEALVGAAEGVKTVAARAEDLPFPSASFDAVIFVVSLQFIEDYRKALAQAARVLRDGGRIVVMLLNPLSAFFQTKLHSPDSYVRKIRHLNLPEMESAIAELFHIQTEYFLGVNGMTLFEIRAAGDAVLYVIKGVRKDMLP